MAQVRKPANGLPARRASYATCRAWVRHLGSHTRIGEKYREWLPESGEELRDFPLYFHYLNLPLETAEADLLTDICR